MNDLVIPSWQSNRNITKQNLTPYQQAIAENRRGKVYIADRFFNMIPDLIPQMSSRMLIISVDHDGSRWIYRGYSPEFESVPEGCEVLYEAVYSNVNGGVDRFTRFSPTEG